MRSLFRILLPLASLFTLPISLAIALQPDQSDGSLFAWIGQMWTRGEIPYLQIFDNKPPGIFCINALAALTHHVLWGVALFYLIFTIACIFSLAQLMRVCRVESLPTFSGAFAAILMINFRDYYAGNMAESFLLWPLSASMLLFARALETRSWRNVYLAGVCSGVACLFKPFGASALAAQLVCTPVFLRTNRAHASAWIGLNVAGVASAWIPAVVYFALHGALTPMLHAAFTYNLYYASASQTNILQTVNLLLTRLAPFVGIILCVLLAATRMLAPRAESMSLGASMRLLALLWFFAGLLLVIAAGRGYEQYFLSLTPSMALGLALSLDTLANARLSRRLMVSAAGVAIAPLIFVYVRGIHHTYPLRAGGADPAIVELQRISTPSTTMLVWGYDPWLFFATGLRNASPYATTHYIYDSRRAYQQIGSTILRDMSQHPPDIIVIAEALQPNARYAPDTVEQEFKSILQTSYTRDWENGSVAIYRHSGPAHPF